MMLLVLGDQKQVIEAIMARIGVNPRDLDVLEVKEGPVVDCGHWCSTAYSQSLHVREIEHTPYRLSDGLMIVFIEIINAQLG